jgi:hypothetical protein
MQISQRFGSAETTLSQLQQPHVQKNVKFGNLASQGLPELGNATKFIVPIMIGSIAYLIHKQSSRMSAALGETLNLVKEGQELAAKGKTKQLIWNGVNSGVGGLGLIGTIWTAFKLHATTTLANATKTTADDALSKATHGLHIGHDAYEYADWAANNAGKWRGQAPKPVLSDKGQAVLDLFKPKAK